MKSPIRKTGKQNNLQQPIGYVVWYQERLRDGAEEGSKILKTLEQAMAFIGQMANSYYGENLNFQLFELGKEIPIEVREDQIETVHVEKKYVARLRPQK